MLQDIFPHTMDISFRRPDPQADDVVFAFQKDQVLMWNTRGATAIPTYEVLTGHYPELKDRVYFLFSIDGVNCFLAAGERSEGDGFAYHSVQIFREFRPSWLGFAGATAHHLAVWLKKNAYCGRCASPTTPSPRERALICPTCGNIVYPNIAPVIIVGVMDGNRLLMTRYAHGSYKKLALVAGFIEIGETMEDAVRREVQEEVGLKVKNIRYYKSQPWAFSQSVLAGFFADLDGSDQMEIDRGELSEAMWIPRDRIPVEDSTISLTYTMIEAFRRKEI